MGLDVYLVRAPVPFADWEAWGDGYETVEHDSCLHPDHLFKVGYFRSSYNGGGFNTYVDQRTGRDLYWVMGGEGVNQSKVLPDWRAMQQRAVQLRDELSQWLRVNGDLGVLHVGFSKHADLPMDRQQALERYADNANRHQGMPGSDYSNALGYFSQGLDVVGVLPGTSPTLHALLGRSHTDVPMVEPCVYVVFRYPAGQGAAWYMDALDVVEETCDYVLHRDKDERPYYGLLVSG